MSYTATIYDDTGNPIVITVTEEESKEAIRNDYNELLKKYNPEYVTFERMTAAPGEELHLKMTMKVPSHYLASDKDQEPKPCSTITCEIIAFLGYPVQGVRAKYPSDCYLASPNVFRSGTACLDEWIPFTSSLLTVTEKLIQDAIHNPVVTRYESPANSAMIEWHKNGVEDGLFPTMQPQLLKIIKIPSMPWRNTEKSKTPALPVRNH